MSIYQNIIDGLKNQGANPDLAQIALIKELCDIKISDTFFIPKFSTKSKNKGLYIWGDVGRGKTLIVNEFIKHIKFEPMGNGIGLIKLIRTEKNSNIFNRFVD